MEVINSLVNLEAIVSSDSANKKLAEYCEILRENIPLNNKVLLVKGPQLNMNAFEREVAKNRCYYAYPFTGAQYLKAALKGRGLDIDILDGNYEFLKRAIEDESFDPLKWTVILDEYFEKNNPSIIGISNLFDVDAPGFMQVSEYLGKNGAGKQIIIAGGQKATYSNRGILKDDICHFALRREAENKINYLFDILYDVKNPREPIEGILFKYGGKIFETEGSKDIVELRGNLVEEYENIPIENYCKVGTLSPFSRMAGKDKPFATVILNRGCHGGCTFCDVTDIAGRKVRNRSAQDFLDEMNFLYYKRGVRHFEFLDDDFAYKKDIVLEVLDGIKESGMRDITWASTNGIIASTLDYKLLEKFRETNCIGFKIGVESGNQEWLWRIEKPGNIRRFREFSKIAQKFPEIFISDNYIIGFPAGRRQEKEFPPENFRQMMDSFKFSDEMNLDWTYFSIYQLNSSYTEERKEWADVYEDFVPTKDVFKGRLQTGKVVKGIDIFKIPYDVVPSGEQLKEIWITFNFARNYILNKNLTPEGRPKKFIDWTRVIQERYPTNPEMSFFLFLAYSLEGNRSEAERQYNMTKENLKDGYWIERFKQYGLTDVFNNFPKNMAETEQVINFLREGLWSKYA